MTPRNLTFTELERLQSRANDTDREFEMDQDSFRRIYERTARPIWVFLWRKTGNAQLADDLLQETYYRFLRSRVQLDSEAHRRNYLFRIAANLANDSFRSPQAPLSLSEDVVEFLTSETDHADRSQKRQDVSRAMSRLPVRQRDALWLAYVEGSSHQEIAEILGLRVRSIKVLLFRARRKLAKLLGGSQ
jgi:RNA polymerase sigma-70 factor (ECF subfamily)